MRTILLGCLTLFSFSACHNKGTVVEKKEKTEYQEQLARDGWVDQTITEGELGEDYGYNPIYGIQDNYFDITMGEGANIAIKIMDVRTNRCIRYALVPENTTITLSQIPQGQYYLKLAYGEDWMEFETDSILVGKFTRGAFYEKSREVYDFGLKNSQQEVNYELKINVRETTGMNNFETRPISEEEFLK